MAGYPVLDAYEPLRLAAERPGAPLCGNNILVSETTGNPKTISARVRRVAGQPYETIASWQVAADTGIFLATTHGGRELLRDTGFGYQRVARFTNGAWASLSQPWSTVQVPSLTGSSQSILSRTHDGDSSVVLVAVGAVGPPNLSFAYRTGQTTGATFTTFSSVPDYWTNPLTGIGLYGGGASAGGVPSPTGGFIINVLRAGNALSTWTFFKTVPATGVRTQLFNESVHVVPNYLGSCQPNCSGVSNPLGISVNEDGSEFTYIVPTQLWQNNTSCVVKRYSMKAGVHLPPDTVTGGQVPGYPYWPSCGGLGYDAARVSGRVILSR